MESQEIERRAVTISRRMLGNEHRILEKQGIELTRLQLKAARERVAYLTAVKHGFPFEPMPDVSMTRWIK